MHLALDKTTGDLFKPDGGGLTRVDEGRFVVQQVQSKLLTLLGEWALDSTVGWVNRDDFVRDYDLFDIEMRARNIIITTQGVLEITSLSSVYSNRTVTVSFTARTIYGEINLEVPWGISN